ncbi:MAG TPA: N-acetyltransferase [Trebonia sp.]|nr:N-acetyltransferase [Trebonia sp.]
MTAADGTPAEAGLVGELRASAAWRPELSLVAAGADGAVIGHVVCSQARLGEAAVLGLGPLSVDPAHQGRGVGSALVHAVLGAADALGEPLVVLLGDPGYYARFGFAAARTRAIAPPVAEWEPYFQVRTLAAYQPSLTGTFRYAEPFDRA